MVAPGLGATVLSMGLASVRGVDAGAQAWIPIVCVVIPALVAWTAAAATREGMARRRWWATAGLVLLSVVVVLALPILLIPALMVVVGRLGERSGVARAGLALGAGLVAVLVAVAMGKTSDWLGLSFAMLVLVPPLVVAAAYLGTVALELVGASTRRLGPANARLASAPLAARRRGVASVGAVLAVVTAVAVLDSTVGASFGRREADRPLAPPTMSAPAGTGADQAIGVIGVTADPATVTTAATEAASSSGTTVTLIDRLGNGGTLLPMEGSPLSSSLDATVGLTPNSTDPGAPTWIGVVEPDALGALGLGRATDDLAAGRLVVLRGTAASTVSPPSYEPDALVMPGTLPTEAVSADIRTPALLPAALVSPAVAEASGLPVRPARVVVTPDPTRPLGREELRSIAQEVVGSSRAGPPAEDADGIMTFIDLLERDQGVRLGDEVMVTERAAGPLNEVPVFARTAEQARDRMVPLAILALLVTVGGVVLVLGTTRAEDAVLELQGAERSTRARLSAVQAGLLAGSSSALAALAGIGLPALAFSTYNGSGRGSLPPIPLVVPWEVPALLVALPLASAVLAGAVVWLRRPPGAAGLSLEDELAW